MTEQRGGALLRTASSPGRATFLELFFDLVFVFALTRVSQRLINGIVRQLESSGEAEIEGQAIGELVLEGLRTLDAVAYVRYASVYRDFRDARDFSELIGRLAAEDKAAGEDGASPEPAEA